MCIPWHKTEKWPKEGVGLSWLGTTRTSSKTKIKVPCRPQTLHPWCSIFQQNQESIIIFWIFVQYTKNKIIWGFVWMQLILELEFGQLPSLLSSCCPSFPLTPVWPLLLPPFVLPAVNPVSPVHQPRSSRGALLLNEAAARHGQTFHKALVTLGPCAAFPLQREQSITAGGPAEISSGTILLH